MDETGGALSLRIRLATTEDAAGILRIYTPIVAGTAISFELEPPTEEEVAARVSRILASERPWLVAEVDDHLSAYAYASAYRERPAYAWSVETSIGVAPASRGMRLGTHLYGRLMEVLTAQGFRSAYAAIAQPNVVSNALHARLGFTPVGTMVMAGFKLGAWRDVQWWQKQFTIDPGEPAPTRRLDAVQSVIRAAVPSRRGVP